MLRIDYKALNELLDGMDVKALRTTYCVLARALGLAPKKAAERVGDFTHTDGTPAGMTASLVAYLWHYSVRRYDTGRRVSSPPLTYGGSRRMEAVYEVDTAPAVNLLRGVFGPSASFLVERP